MKEKKDLVNEWELRYCGCSVVSFGLEMGCNILHTQKQSGWIDGLLGIGFLYEYMHHLPSFCNNKVE
jgi:hypothetical protein